MAHDEDVVNNPTSNPHIDDLIATRLADPAPRRLLHGGLGAAPLAFIGAPHLAGCASTAASPPESRARPTSLGFNAVPKSLADTVSVPTGYTVTVLYRLGDPIAAGVPAYSNNG